MSERDALTDLLRRHDRPVTPSAGFADRLEARLLAELGPVGTGTAARRSDVVSLHARPRGGVGLALGRRPRWLDMAAAAVLLLGVMGGMLSQLAVRDDAGGLVPEPATIAAPDFLSTAAGEEAPVMEGGSPSRDNVLPGPPLSAGDLEERWRVQLDSERPEGARIGATVLPFRDLVYVATQTSDGQAPGQLIEARDLATGEVRWTTTTKSTAASPTVSADGLLVVEQEGVAAIEVNQAQVTLRMLDLTTGAERWSYQLDETTNWNFHGALMAEGTVYYVDADGVAYALDAATGAERWVSSVGRTQADARHSTCVSPVENCRLGGAAYHDGTLYLVNGAAEIHALDAATGNGVWSADLGGRYALDRNAVEVLATGRGPVVTMVALGETVMEGGYGEIVGRRTTLLDRESGGEVWTRDDVADQFAAADGERLYLTHASVDQECCLLMALDLVTGETVWVKRPVGTFGGYSLGITGGASPAVLLAESPDGRDVEAVVGLDPATGAEIWRLRLGDWFPVLPLASDGTLIARGDDGSLRAYRPAPAVAPADQVAVMEGGSPARDERHGGPELGEGELVERWVAPDHAWEGLPVDLQVVPVGETVYRVVGEGLYDQVEGFNAGDFAVEAHRLDSGALIWSHPTVPGVRVAATAAGVVAVVPAGAGADGAMGTRLALLDAATGAEAWVYDLPATSGVNQRSPIVDGGTAYYVDIDATVYALDLATGAERWVSRAATATATDAERCSRGWGACGFGGFAVGDGAIYVFNRGGRLLALDLSDGTPRWEVDIVGRYQLPIPPLVLLTAVDGGVILNLVVDATEFPASTQEGRYVRLDAATGADVWERRITAQIGFTAVSDGERLFVGQSDEFGGCCAIVALNLASGGTVWESEASRVYPLGTVGDDLYAIASISVGGNQTLYALDPATGVERRRWQVPAGTPSLPLAEDGTIFVDGFGFAGAPAGLFAYRPA